MEVGDNVVDLLQADLEIEESVSLMTSFSGRVPECSKKNCQEKKSTCSRNIYLQAQTVPFVIDQ